MTVSVVLVSAGKGTRLGASVPKAVVSVAGKTLLELSLMHISEFKPDQLIVVAPDGLVPEFERLTAKFFSDFKVVVGGIKNSSLVSSASMTEDAFFKIRISSESLIMRAL